MFHAKFLIDFWVTFVRFFIRKSLLVGITPLVMKERTFSQIWNTSASSKFKVWKVACVYFNIASSLDFSSLVFSWLYRSFFSWNWLWNISIFFFMCSSLFIDIVLCISVAWFLISVYLDFLNDRWGIWWI